MSLTLPPDENTGPAPVRITTRTEGSALMRSTAATNSSTAVLPVSALRVSGWFIVSVTTPPLLLVVQERCHGSLPSSGRIGGRQVAPAEVERRGRRCGQQAPRRVARASTTREPQSARQACRRRVKSCRSNSSVMPIAPWIAWAMARPPRRRFAGARLGRRPRATAAARCRSRGAADLRRHARRERLLGHHAELVLDGLELADRPAELRAVVGVCSVASSTRCIAPAISVAASSAPTVQRDAGIGKPAVLQASSGQLRCACRLPCTPVARRRPAPPATAGQRRRRPPAPSRRARRTARLGNGSAVRRAGCLRGEGDAARAALRRRRCASSARAASSRPAAPAPRGGRRRADGKASRRPSPAPPAASLTSASSEARILDSAPTARRPIGCARSRAPLRACSSRPGTCRRHRRAACQCLHQRRPSPRAIMPRRMSRVPPRSEKDGPPA